MEEPILKYQLPRYEFYNFKIFFIISYQEYKICRAKLNDIDIKYAIDLFSNVFQLDFYVFNLLTNST